MRFAFADPPYLGCCALYSHRHDAPYLCWDDLATHSDLISRLAAYDAWALSTSSVALRDVLALCPSDVRVGAWVKSFASFKPNVNPAYAWEPVIFSGARTQRDRSELTVRDWVSCPITLKRGLTGAKPDEFCFWLFDLLGARPGDDFDDLFIGSGAVTRAWDAWCRQSRMFTTEVTA